MAKSYVSIAVRNGIYDIKEINQLLNLNPEPCSGWLDHEKGIAVIDMRMDKLENLLERIVSAERWLQRLVGGVEDVGWVGWPNQEKFPMTTKGLAKFLCGMSRHIELFQEEQSLARIEWEDEWDGERYGGLISLVTI